MNAEIVDFVKKKNLPNFHPTQQVNQLKNVMRNKPTSAKGRGIASNFNMMDKKQLRDNRRKIKVQKSEVVNPLFERNRIMMQHGSTDNINPQTLTIQNSNSTSKFAPLE